MTQLTMFRKMNYKTSLHFITFLSVDKPLLEWRLLSLTVRMTSLQMDNLAMMRLVRFFLKLKPILVALHRQIIIKQTFKQNMLSLLLMILSLKERHRSLNLNLNQWKNSRQSHLKKNSMKELKLTMEIKLLCPKLMSEIYVLMIKCQRTPLRLFL